MIPPLETLSLAGWHPDAGVWYLLLVASVCAIFVVVRPVRK